MINSCLVACGERRYRVPARYRRAIYFNDALGRRAAKVVTLPQERHETRFLWHGWRLLQSRTDERQQTYCYDPDEDYTPLACIERYYSGDRLYWYHTGLNGSPQEVTDEQGEMVWSGQYGMFGEVARQTDAMWRNFSQPLGRFRQPLRYAGQYLDEETGLHYNTFRYYAPEVGRFITPDPIGLAGGLNLYAYVKNPLTWIDPLGLAGCPSKSGQLPELRGKSVSQVEKILSQHGFTQIKVSNSAAKNQVWKHADGSEVRIHPYGNQSMNMANGQLTPKSGLNAHIHKQNPSGDQLNDLGHVSTNPDLTHIGIRNPSDYPTVRGRPHGSGR